MDGTAELLQLAHLLRITATTAREIATMRKVNVIEIDVLAQLTERIADDMEKVARAPSGDSRSFFIKTS